MTHNPDQSEPPTERPNQKTPSDGKPEPWNDKDRIDFFERIAFCAFRLDSGFISIGLPHGVSGSGLTLREAIDDLVDNQSYYEIELSAKTGELSHDGM